ncbi:GntR family transcriptional regulator [Evansella cellulosilytica]|uniref:Transcriptional regulator, GntR family n=1 Tax=Evansella cellulosilytica (strain ATCC 21833 / DSM 2522 / FERM P-1141 / JCM 9156 / N-4) TaxID=649639 RepID=E6TUK2_EVAC2|nr:GntR family transcriptional regulator [Evansella cellulosilytica]ADU30892.1 transcriptional regulator, GntR family [Evansella cellulosilytica DSM 2522]
MKIQNDSNKPIYIQIAEWLEAEILAGSFKVDDKVYSQYQLAEMFTINPATAAKGLTMLVDERILYKRRGLGMFVSSEAKEMILNKRKSNTLVKLVKDLVQEANRLDVKEEELILMIKREKEE